VTSDLRGHVAVITGGNGGIGLGMARGLVAAGADVALWGRDEAKNAAAAKELQAVSPSTRVRRGSGDWSTASCQSGVSMLPGDTALTRTPWRASSIASALVNDSTAPLLATYVVA